MHTHLQVHNHSQLEQRHCLESNPNKVVILTKGPGICLNYEEVLT